MASVDETVERMIAAHPNLHQTRIQVLHHLFCVAVNGHRWKKGEIVPRVNSTDLLIPWSRARAEENVLDTVSGIDSMPSYVKQTLRASLLPRWDEYEVVVAEAKERAIQKGSDLEHKAYPQKPEALLMRVPKNVTSDWAAAAEEVKSVVRAHGWTV